MQNSEEDVMTPSVHNRPKDVRGLGNMSTHGSILVEIDTTTFILY